MLVAVPVIARDALLNALLRHLKIYADPAVFPAGRRKHPQFQGIQGGAGVPICRIGKKMMHTGDTGTQWGIGKEELMERISESAKATADHFGDYIAYINVLRNMSVSCDCEGTAAQPVVTPNIGILASTDILAADQASVDLVYALPEKYRHDLVERMETRHGLRQLSYMKELGMGCDRYVILDVDHGDKPITLAEAVKNVKPFKA